MDIKVDMEIGKKIMDKSNEFFYKNKVFPTKVTLNSEQYKDLWLMTFYTWTRQLNSPHVLTDYGGLEISISLTKEIICS